MGLLQDQVDQFEHDGYLVVDDAIDPLLEFSPLLSEYSCVLDGLAEYLYANGAIAGTYRDWPFGARLLKISREAGRNLVPYFDFTLPPRTTVDLRTPMFVGHSIFHLTRNQAILDIVESIVGPEIYVNPVQHIRIKLPQEVLPGGEGDGNTDKTVWHQDGGVVLPEADESGTLTVWAPLNPATIDNGCLQLVPGSHREGLVDHCPTGFVAAIPEVLVEDREIVDVPLNPGSLLLIHNRLVHASRDNTTADQVRISLDLRYQKAGFPTGRPGLPGFVGRSRSNPDSELTDPIAWAQSWREARERLARDNEPRVYHRWGGDAKVCG